MKRSRFSKEQIISILREGDLVEDRPALQPALGDTQHQAMDHGVSVLDPASQRRLHPFQRRFGEVFFHTPPSRFRHGSPKTPG